MFLFIELFINDLKSLHRTQFNYVASPLFRLLFEEVIKFKGYYIAAFGNFTFTNILETEDALKTLEPLVIEVEPSISEKVVEYIDNTNVYIKKSQVLLTNQLKNQLWIWIFQLTLNIIILLNLPNH